MRRRSDDASPREQHNRGERRRTWRDPGLDGWERFLGKFSDDSCTADPRGLAVNPSAAVTIRGAEAKESGGRFSAKLHEFLGRLNNVVNGPRPSAGCMPRISHDVKAENRGKSGQEQSLIDLRQRKAVVP